MSDQELMSGKVAKERVTPVPSNYLRISVLEVRNARHAVCQPLLVMRQHEANLQVMMLDSADVQEEVKVGSESPPKKRHLRKKDFVGVCCHHYHRTSGVFCRHYDARLKNRFPYFGSSLANNLDLVHGSCTLLCRS